MSDELNPKQKTFVVEYLKDMNGTQAAIRAGYSAKTAASQASELLSLPKVKQFLDHRLEKRARKGSATLDEVKARLTEFMNRDDIKPADSIRAGELLAKMEGGFIERIEHEVSVLTDEQRAEKLNALMLKARSAEASDP